MIGVRVREVEEDSIMVGASTRERKLREKEAKEKRRRERAARAPSAAPLNQQDSCVVS